jgi:hypothetical protein
VTLLLGPTLRHVSDTTALVWVQTDCTGTVEVLGCSARTFAVPAGTVTGSPKLMLAMVIVAAPAAVGLSAPVVSVAVAAAVVVVVVLVASLLLDPPHAVAIAATAHTATQSQIFFIVTPNNSDRARGTRLSLRNSSKDLHFGVVGDDYKSPWLRAIRRLVRAPKNPPDPYSTL